jgi:cell division protease FtsH
VIALAATNRPDVLDPALMRPGRFDRKVVLELPRREARHQILIVHSRRVKLADDVDLELVAKRTAGFAGADLENLINEAALLAGRDNKDEVSMYYFDLARDKVVLGPERESILSDDEKRRIAYHESGHALLALVLSHTDPIDKVTIIPRGRALGATQQLLDEEHQNLSESYLRDRITVMLGGRVSEKLVFDEKSSGAEEDLRQATALARRMISRWGMSKKLGAVAFRRGEDHVFLGREMTQPPDFSDYTARLIDEEIRDLLGELEDKAHKLLAEHRDQLDALAEALLQHESLDAAEIRELVNAAEKVPS